MSNSISRRTFLKCTGASVAALGAASLLGGCQQNGSATIVDVKVGDKVSNWNGLGVQLTSLFNIDTAPAQAGYEYIAVLVTVVNRTKNQTFNIGAQNLAEINAAYPVPPQENVDNHPAQFILQSGGNIIHHFPGKKAEKEFLVLLQVLGHFFGSESFLQQLFFLLVGIPFIKFGEQPFNFLDCHSYSIY